VGEALLITVVSLDEGKEYSTINVQCSIFK
jgi:hypothetical protein